MRKIIETGETLRLYLDYTDIDSGADIDPLVLSASYTSPDGVETEIDYPSDNFVRESAGHYFVRINAIQSGTYTYRITAQTSLLDIDVRDGKFDSEPTE
jgi:hypothetical protein